MLRLKPFLVLVSTYGFKQIINIHDKTNGVLVTAILCAEVYGTFVGFT